MLEPDSGDNDGAGSGSAAGPDPPAGGAVSAGERGPPTRGGIATNEGQGCTKAIAEAITKASSSKAVQGTLRANHPQATSTLGMFSNKNKLPQQVTPTQKADFHQLALETILNSAIYRWHRHTQALLGAIELYISMSPSKDDLYLYLTMLHGSPQVPFWVRTLKIILVLSWWWLWWHQESALQRLRSSDNLGGPPTKDCKLVPDCQKGEKGVQPSWALSPCKAMQCSQATALLCTKQTKVLACNLHMSYGKVNGWKPRLTSDTKSLLTTHTQSFPNSFTTSPILPSNS